MTIKQTATSLKLVVIFYAILFAGPCAEAGPLADLYRGFLTDTNSQVFASFRRDNEIPKQLQKQRQYKLDDGRNVTLNYLATDHEFFSIARQGSNFLVAHSKTMPLTNIVEIQNAEDLYGFDGQFYWAFGLDHQFGMVGPSKGTNHSSARNPLVIIPVTELSHPQGKYQSDVHIKLIKIFKQQGLDVLQFGWNSENGIGPDVAGSVLPPTSRKSEQLQNGTQNPSLEFPTVISYKDQTGRKIVASLDYDNDDMVITRSTRTGKILFKANYHLFMLEPLSSNQTNLSFSWQTYMLTAKDVLATLITNGATMLLDFTNANKFHATATLLTPVKTSDIARLRIKLIAIYSIFTFATAGALILMWKTKHNNSINTNV